MDDVRAGGLVPIVTPEEMGAIDRAAPEPVEVLIGRAGAAVARAALDLLGGAYGRRVVVVAGKGNNGNDGRDAARRLRARGVRVVTWSTPPTRRARLPAGGPRRRRRLRHGLPRRPTGPLRPRRAPRCSPSTSPPASSGLTGEPSERVLAADAHRHLRRPQAGAGAPARARAGRPGARGGHRARHLRALAPTSSARRAVAGWLPERPVVAHKWQSAVWVVAGSPGMGGAAELCTSGAARAGAGYVRLSTPGGRAEGVPVEVVQVDLPADGWATEVLGGLDRFAALTVGNGLGTGAEAAAQIRSVVAGAAARGRPDGRRRRRPHRPRHGRRRGSWARLRAHTP